MKKVLLIMTISSGVALANVKYDLVNQVNGALDEKYYFQSGYNGDLYRHDNVIFKKFQSVEAMLEEKDLLSRLRKILTAYRPTLMRVRVVRILGWQGNVLIREYVDGKTLLEYMFDIPNDPLVSRARKILQDLTYHANEKSLGGEEIYCLSPGNVVFKPETNELIVFDPY